jgi:hypothetical protein
LLLLAGCASGGGARWYAPATWFSHAPAAAADKAHAVEQRAQASVDSATDKATRAAHIEFAKADFASLSLPPSRSTDLVRRFLPNGLGLFDQVQPLTAAESADLRQIVAGLQSDSAAKVADAEKKQTAAETESSRLSRELTAAQALADAAKAKSDGADKNLRAAFDRENGLANDLRAQHARFWIAVAVAILVSLGALYLKVTLGGVGAALHAAGAPSAVMEKINAETSALGQWLIKGGRIAAAKAEAVLQVHAGEQK